MGLTLDILEGQNFARKNHHGVGPRRAGAAELAAVDALDSDVHAGSHRSIDLAYGALATHVARYERPADGPLREHYLVGPLDTSDESAWRTEIESPSVLIMTRFQKPPVNLY